MQSMNSLAGRVAVVTGGSRGIGRAIVERLAANGADVLFSYVDDGAAADQVVAGATASPGEVHATRADLASIADVRALFERAAAQLGGVDILVNNAGVGVQVPIADTTEEDYEFVMGTNARGTFFLFREAARRLRDGGRIISISTINTVRPAQNIALYCASKAAIEQFTAVAAKELGGRGITVNTVSPGFTDTDLLRSVNPSEAFPQLAALSPLGRLGRPDDIADTVAFLASDAGSWLTGQNLRACGGVA